LDPSHNKPLVLFLQARSPALKCQPATIPFERIVPIVNVRFNKADAANPAMTRWLTIEDPRRQVADPHRSADSDGLIKKGLKMKSRLFAVSLTLLAATAGFGQTTNYPRAKVSFDDFKGLVAQVETHRASRLIDLNTFLKMSKEPGVIILDSRSDFRFDRIHVKGAKHLAFTDYTQDNLKKVIPTFETKILIYCNNNFDGNQKDFASKVAVPRAKPGNAAATQFAAQAKPLMMALNIPTYINLYGYGYRNVYELHELVNVNDPRIAFEGSIVEQKSPPVAPRVTK
jgi:hypothetical protein